MRLAKTDQTAQMRSLICVFAGRTSLFEGFVGLISKYASYISLEIVSLDTDKFKLRNQKQGFVVKGISLNYIWSSFW